MSAATGIAASTIGRGLKELTVLDTLAPDRIRRPGGGRKLWVAKDATLLDDLLALVESSERGDPTPPLRWTCKSLSQLTAALVAQGHRIGRTVVGELLHKQKPSLQAHRKTREGEGHPDRDAQFVHINNSVKAALAAGQPVISVDTKRKELVGDKNAGQAWRPRGEPGEVRVHDFLIKELGRAVPYGVYDLAANAGWVGVGVNHDTAAFAVQTIRRWWTEIGSARYPDAARLQRNPKDLRGFAGHRGGVRLDGDRGRPAQGPAPWQRAGRLDAHLCRGRWQPGAPAQAAGRGWVVMPGLCPQL